MRKRLTALFTRGRTTTLGELVGASSIAAGCWTWSPGLGLVVGGVLLVTGSVLADRPGGGR